MFHKCFKSVSKKVLKCIVILKVFQRISEVFKGFKGVSRVFHRSFLEVSRIFLKRLIEV